MVRRLPALLFAVLIGLPVGGCAVRDGASDRGTAARDQSGPPLSGEPGGGPVHGESGGGGGGGGSM